MSFGDILKEVLSVTGEAIKYLHEHSNNPRTIYLQQLKAMRESLSAMENELKNMYKMLNERTDLSAKDKQLLKMDISDLEAEFEQTKKEYFEMRNNGM